MSASECLPLPPFQWGVSAEEIKQSCEEILRLTKENLDRVAQTELSAPPEGEEERRKWLDDNYKALIEPLMAPPNYKTNHLLCQTKFLQHCHTNPEIRKAASESGVKFSNERVKGRMRKDVYEKVKQFADVFIAVGQSDPERQYQLHYVRSILSDFERTGLGLSAEQSMELKELLEKDTTLCTEYKNNIANDTTTILFRREELEGMEESFLASRTSADDENIIAITLKYPDIVPINSNCPIESTRKRIFAARNVEAYKNNLDLLAEAVGVRQRIAKLLGYQHYADFITEKRMTGSAKTALDFLDSLHQKLESYGKDEKQRLIELKKKVKEEQNQPTSGEEEEEEEEVLNEWDLSFYHHLLLKREYGVNEEQIQEYFPVNHVVQVTMEIYQELLSLVFKEVDKGSFSTWHEDVRLFVVYDKESQQLQGHFYLDLHPRDGKYTHNAIFHLLKRWKNQAPVDCMLANLPVASASKPALLRHGDVVTFFHEFGHIMHGLCTEGDGNSTHLAKCPRDFVEAPSQMLENWCWEEPVLRRISSHYQTKEPLPSALIEQLLKAKNVNESLFTLRQIYLAKMDMELHTLSDLNAKMDTESVLDLSNRLKSSISLVNSLPDASILRSFGHLMNQYAAAYHGYLWSEVLSADMYFSRFAVEGIDNPNTGMAYRKYILAPGGVGSIFEHVKRFLGRDPEQNNFLKSKGLL